MNVLLINPNREQMPWPAIPVGLCHVATALRRAGHDVEVLDLTFARRPARRVLAAVRRRRPEVVGITIRNIDNCNLEHPVFYLPRIRDEVVRPVREGAPAARVVLGGAGLNIAPAAVLELVEGDWALAGEGETAMPALLAALQRGEDPAALPGLVGRGALPASASAAAPQPVRATDLWRAAASEAFRWIDLRPYAARGAAYPVQTKRGCAQRCSYCAYRTVEGEAYRLRDPAAVADEVEEVLRGQQITTVEIVDSTFNLPVSHATAVCEALAARRLPGRLTTMGLNPAGLRPELLALMRRAGFDAVMCSAESASDVTLEALGKGYDRGAVIRAAEALRRSGLRTFWFFLFGAPGETLDTVRETLAFCEEHVSPTDVVLFSTGIRVLPGTPLAQQLKSQGWFEANDPLLLPSWYVAPTVELTALYDLLAAAARAHPNWMTNGETILPPAMATAMKRAFALLGWDGPFWTHLPKLFALTGRLGARAQTLAATRARLQALGPLARHDRGWIAGEKHSGD